MGAQLAGPRKLYPGKCAGPSHYFRDEGGEVLLKMVRELQKELQLSPQTAAFPWCQPP